MTGTATAVTTALADVDVQNLLTEESQKGIRASEEAASKVKKMLEEQLSMANFQLVDDLNAKFSTFLQYEDMQDRLQMLLEKAGGTQSKNDVGDALNDTMRSIHDITDKLDTSKVALEAGSLIRKIIDFFSGGSKSPTEVFQYGMASLKGKVEVIETVMTTEKQNVENVVDLIKTYLPEITEDVIRLEYLDRFLTKFLNAEEAKALPQEAQDFLREYQVSLATMKQVSSVSVLRVLMGLNRIVKAKFTLDKVEMKFTMNLGTLVFENLISNQVKSSYDLADSIDEGLEALEKKNEELQKDNMQAEIDRKKKNLDVLHGLEGKLLEIKTDYESYNAEIDRLNGEVKDYLPKYQETYGQLQTLREQVLNKEKAAEEAMKGLIDSPAFDEENLIAENKKLEIEVEEVKKEVEEVKKA